MSQAGKSSIKRGKPSYFMSILGVTLVLFLLGIIGWLMINANKLGNYFKESVEVRAYLRGDLNPKDSVALMNYISAKPYVKSVEFVTKEAAIKSMAQDDQDWNKVLDANPLPNSINFKVKKEYLNVDSLKTIRTDLEQQTYVNDVQYPEALVDKMNKNIEKISLYALIIAILLSVVVIILIDNTIRLAMFSNRFLIKTMQMVGATRNFIARPMNIKAVVNGSISAAIAIVAIWLIIMFLESRIPYLNTIHDNFSLFLLFFSMLVLGICITVFSTHRSVVKYLKMKLDDLY